jgi:CheY-like chemotaxis protein
MHNLLIIDDEVIIINLLHDYFSHLGYSVVTAKDGSEGIDLFNTSPNFDLVITDINMPGIDGNAVAKSIRLSQRTKVPIVGMSGYNDKAEGELFDFMLAKPFNLKELMAVVKTIEGENEAHLT